MVSGLNLLEQPCSRPLQSSSGAGWEAMLPRCRENMAYIRQSRPDSGLGVQIQIITAFQAVRSLFARKWGSRAQGPHSGSHCVRTGSWTGPPQGKRAAAGPSRTRSSHTQLLAVSCNHCAAIPPCTLQKYLAHQKHPPPPRTTIGPQI